MTVDVSVCLEQHNVALETS